MTKTDIELKQDVEDELRFDPKVNAADIGVTVKNGAISLLGEVDTFADKLAAEDAVKRVGGVRAVAEELTVRLLNAHQHSDSEIAEAVLRALKWDVWVPPTVTAKIEQGRVSLEGKVEWKFQSDAAQRAIRYLEGVVSVSNRIAIQPRVSAEEVKKKVQAALSRQASVDAKAIHVETSGGTVTLSGNAASWRTIGDAATAAWAAPGVTGVVENIVMTGV